MFSFSRVWTVTAHWGPGARGGWCHFLGESEGETLWVWIFFWDCQEQTTSGCNTDGKTIRSWHYWWMKQMIHFSVCVFIIFSVCVFTCPGVCSALPFRTYSTADHSVSSFTFIAKSRWVCSTSTPPRRLLKQVARGSGPVCCWWLDVARHPSCSYSLNINLIILIVHTVNLLCGCILYTWHCVCPSW